MISPLIIGIIAVIILIFIILAKLYTIVPANFADVSIRGNEMRVYSSHANYSDDNKGAYFNVPSWFFLFNLGMRIHRIPLKIIPINVPDFLAFDKDRARFVCNIVAFVTVNNPITAAQRFSGDMEQLKIDVSKVVQATTRDATTKRAIREIINNRDDIIGTIKNPLAEALKHWGLDLRDIELVEFRDPKSKEHGEESHVIQDISSIIEEQINSEARQKNAEQKKTARLKEAEAEEIAKKREIAKDEEIGKREKQKEKLVSVEAKSAKYAELEVTKVQQVKTQEIEKERQIVEAEQRKEVETINKEQKKLIGEGTKLQQEEEAKGLAAPIREKGLAEAEAKDKLQAALNKFGDKAIRTLVAEKIVEMQQVVGVAGAKALESADMKVFAGSEGDRSGFDTGKLLSALTVGNESMSKSILNRLSKPNDLGIGTIGIGTSDNKPTQPEKTPPKPEEVAQKKTRKS